MILPTLFTLKILNQIKATIKEQVFVYIPYMTL